MRKQRYVLNYLLVVISSLILSCLSTTAYSLSFPMPVWGDDIIGRNQIVYASEKDTLSAVGIAHNIGYIEMLEANPDLPARAKLIPGTPITIPSQFILPSVRQGLVVNLAELRVYYFPANEKRVYTFPLGVGKQEWVTPIAVTTVIKKIKDPAWRPPESIRKESASHGKILPKIILPGPNNPLGKYELKLALPGILMHGTNSPATVGRRASHGCMRMLPEDIQFLYGHVPLGTLVSIIYESNKIGWLGNQLYLEAERPFPEHDDSASLEDKIKNKMAEKPGTIVNWRLVEQIVDKQDGMPHVIGSY